MKSISNTLYGKKLFSFINLNALIKKSPPDTSNNANSHSAIIHTLFLAKAGYSFSHIFSHILYGNSSYFSYEYCHYLQDVSTTYGVINFKFILQELMYKTYKDITDVETQLLKANFK